MYFAFLHGEQFVYLIGLVVACLFAYLIALAALWLWWRFTSRSRAQLAIFYLVHAAIACIMLALNGDSQLWLLLSVALTLPWSSLPVLGFFNSSGEPAFAIVLLLCAWLNAAIIYLAAEEQAEHLFNRGGAG